MNRITDIRLKIADLPEKNCIYLPSNTPKALQKEFSRIRGEWGTLDGGARWDTLRISMIMTLTTIFVVVLRSSDELSYITEIIMMF